MSLVGYESGGSGTSDDGDEQVPLGNAAVPNSTYDYDGTHDAHEYPEDPLLGMLMFFADLLTGLTQCIRRRL